MRKSTEADYVRRILWALEFIRENLDREFTLEELASAACFSPFHFHRVFTGMTGETVAGLVRRLKLERAAQRLIEGSEPVLVIALRTGYDPNQAFTRAFSSAFGEPPSRFRELRKAVPHLCAPSGYHYHPESVVAVFNPVRKGDRTMDAKTVELNPLKVLCMRHIGPYNLIGGAFEKLDGEVGMAGIDTGKSQWLAIY
ncbi:AraC family transcriptional regulator [Candidatus Fermentibacteria bacterium]|nr:AraC family transcriptional regulator [Candidatus Fermentibacteria bacterium]